MYNFASEVLKKVGYVISQTTQGMTDLLETVGKTMTYLPYIIGAAAVGFVGFKIYSFKKSK